MNLFYDPTITELHQLVNSASNSVDKHNVVIDYDGEVIIDPEMKYHGIPLNRFKFHTTITESVKNNARSLNALFQTLVEAYNDNNIQMNRMFNSAA